MPTVNQPTTNRTALSELNTSIVPSVARPAPTPTPAPALEVQPTAGIELVRHSTPRTQPKSSPDAAHEASTKTEVQPKKASRKSAKTPAVVPGRDAPVRYTYWITLGYLTLLAYIIIQCVFILQRQSGPRMDEATYIVAGIRTLQGQGIQDGYLSWFAGSLLWPLLAGLGFTLKGLLLVRFTAMAFGFVTLVALYSATRNLFDARVACFTAMAFVANSTMLVLGHLGVSMSPAVALLAISLACLSQLTNHPHRFWICAAAVAFALAVITEYLAALMLLPLLGVLAYVRQDKRRTDIFLFLFLATGLFLAFLLSFQYQFGDWVSSVTNTVATPRTSRLALLMTQAYFTGIPCVIAALGFLLAGKKKLTIFLLIASVLFPLYHGLTGIAADMDGNAGFGFLFLYPLIGLVCALLWKRMFLLKFLALIVLAGLIVLGVYQYPKLDNNWPDIRQPATYLAQQAKPGDTFLINDSWSYSMYLYAQHKIKAPDAVLNNYQITHSKAKINICQYNWFVETKWSNSWPATITKQLRACKNFVPVYFYEQKDTALKSNFQILKYTDTVTIWKNINSHITTNKTPGPSKAGKK
ncbi:glycosyltransferase family 39 protein [Dictyobacter vulcani]|uniref:glycosyltransferase family 39 protein n=1 Tax=Dictyobacter vulcani TaxID=2607529 RepID=UPI001386D5E2|nr:glycosyltransferase family 39 protein [Dictyobacter vulcani]